MLKGIVTDIDGTLTDPERRIDTLAVEVIRDLIAEGVEVVFASGNTSCFMDALSKMVGTRGIFIAENGGVVRLGYERDPLVFGDQGECHRALAILEEYYLARGRRLEHFSPANRFADVAFAKTVPVDEVREVLAGEPVQVLDTGFAIHLQSHGVSKGTAFATIAAHLGLITKDFLAIGDAENDIPMMVLAGAGATVANAEMKVKLAATYVSKESYGGGFTDAVAHYFPTSSRGTGRRRCSL